MAKPKKQKEPEIRSEMKQENMPPCMYMNMPLMDGKDFLLMNHLNYAMYFPLSSEQIAELASLREMFVQLLIQAYLMSTNANSRKRALYILTELCSRHNYIVRCCLKQIGKYSIEIINLKVFHLHRVPMSL